MSTGIFWTDDLGDGETAQGGIFFRNIDFHAAIKKIEDSGKKVVGIKIDIEEGKNIEFLTT